MTDKIQVHLGIPTYSGVMDEGTMSSAFHAAKSRYLGNIQIQSQSWLQRNFNAIYCAGLNGRRDGVTHVALLHADVAPLKPDWFDVLVELSLSYKADMLSAVIPLKSEQGFTSTALDVFNPPYSVKRMTMTEVFKEKPTFTHPKILLNTGLTIIDIRKPWAETLCFEFQDAIIKLPNGQFKEVGVPEDWNFSRKVRACGGSLYATREIPLLHKGLGRFDNLKPWGTVAEEIKGPPDGVKTPLEVA